MKQIILESFNDFVNSKLIAEKEQLITEGQFSWFTQDTDRQIGSERENTITVYMYDNEGNQYRENKYEGYGVFGGMDYYELLARMNGYSEQDQMELRQLGIDLAFGKIKTKNKNRKLLFPALVEDPRYNWKRHDFTEAPDDDPNQSWYIEDEDDYDYDYDDDDSYESARKNYSLEKALNEGNAFGAARAEAIANGEDSFEVDGETYPVEDVDAEDKENAEEFAGESLDQETFEYGFNEAFGNDASMKDLVDILSNYDKMSKMTNKDFMEAAKSIRYFSKRYDRELEDVFNEYKSLNMNQKKNWSDKEWLKWLEAWPLAESNEVNEALKSAKLAQLFNTKVSGHWSSEGVKDLAKAFYAMTKIALDEVEDEDIIDATSQEAHSLTKNDKDDRYVIFYIVDQEKGNPYAGYGSPTKVLPGLLAIVKGNKFQGISWRDKERTLVSSDPLDSVGVSKKYKGWDSTGLYSPKRISDVADRAILIDTYILKDKYSTARKRFDREDAKKGAIAFKSDADFKRENMNRYKEILATKVSKLPLDKMVKDAIDEITLQIKQGLSKNELINGEPVIGISAKGSVVTLRSAANHMSNILDDYASYVRYSNELKDAFSSSYYEEQMKYKAVSIKNKIDEIKSMNYAW